MMARRANEVGGGKGQGKESVDIARVQVTRGRDRLSTGGEMDLEKTGGILLKSVGSVRISIQNIHYSTAIDFLLMT